MTRWFLAGLPIIIIICLVFIPVIGNDRGLHFSICRRIISSHNRMVISCGLSLLISSIKGSKQWVRKRPVGSNHLGDFRIILLVNEWLQMIVNKRVDG